VTDTHQDPERPDEPAQAPAEMRLRTTRPPVTRLSRKVLLGLGIVAAVGIGGALFLALQPNRETTGASELYNTNNGTTPGRSSVRRCPAISAGRSSMPVGSRPAFQRQLRPPIPRSNA
jgi:hypothetical protein